MIRKVGIVLLVGTISLLGIFSISAMAYQEAPELRALVAAGELPPVEERLPKDPLVKKGFDGIGRYGGILHIVDVALTPPVVNTQNWVYSGTSGFTTDMYAFGVKSVEMSNGGREWTIHMREGMKWSDGAPFTADDIMFWYKDFVLNEELNPNFPGWLKSGGEPVKFEKVDEYTVKVSSSLPFDLINSEANYWLLSLPKHYLSQFHPSYVDKDKLDKMVKETGFDSWWQLFQNKNDAMQTRNPDNPTLLPWVLVQAAPAIPVIYKRNPYFWAVDEEGNQLPYIDGINQIFTGSGDVQNLKFLAGEADYARSSVISMYPLLKSAEKAGKIKVYRWGDSAVNTTQLEFNLTHKDPVVKEIFQDKRFRFAVSYAVDRQMISNLLFLGAVEPWQVAPSENSRYYHERLAHTALEYDTVKASKLLDEIGLDKRDADGWRLRPDGKRLTIIIMTAEGFLEDAGKLGEIITANLRAVGLDINLRVISDSLLFEKLDARDYDCLLNRQSWGTNEGKFVVGRQSPHFVVTGGMGFWCPEWKDWYNSKGEKGEEPPPVMLEAIEAFEKAQATFDPKEQEFWFKKVLDIAADNLWTIGTVNRFGQIVITNPKLKNVPTSFKVWWRGDSGFAPLYFYEE